jgi:uncharacterized protein
MSRNDRPDPLDSSTDVAFSPSVRRVQRERGSRDAYARVERAGGFAVAIDDRLRALLAGIDTAFLATASADGQPYVQHRGGPRGFLRAVDDHTLAFGDRTGNRQYVTTGNLADNDRVCLLAIDYARRRRVKIWGTARIEPVTAEWRAALGVAAGDDGLEQVVVITVRAWDVNCPQHIPAKVDVADAAAVIARLEERIAELEARLAVTDTPRCP